MTDHYAQTERLLNDVEDALSEGRFRLAEIFSRQAVAHSNLAVIQRERYDQQQKRLARACNGPG